LVQGTASLLLLSLIELIYPMYPISYVSYGSKAELVALFHWKSGSLTSQTRVLCGILCMRCRFPTCAALPGSLIALYHPMLPKSLCYLCHLSISYVYSHRDSNRVTSAPPASKSRSLCGHPAKRTEPIPGVRGVAPQSPVAYVIYRMSYTSCYVSEHV